MEIKMSQNRGRLLFIMGCCYFLIAIIFFRLLYLQIYKHDEFKTRSKRQIRKVIKIDAHRGTIYDRHGDPLAISRPSYSIYAVPPEIKDKHLFAEHISKLLNQDKLYVYEKINTKFPFVWLKRKTSEEIRDAVVASKLKGVSFLVEEKRYYPNNDLAGDVLGFVGTDKGLGGLEYAFDDLLRGSSGQVIVEGDPRGYRLISGYRDVQGKPTGFQQGVKGLSAHSFDGGHIYVTLDKTIQYAAEKALREGVQRYHAKKGQVIVMDPHTGDILAMADYPSFNPNHFYRYSNAILKNSTVVDVFEPGSVFKMVVYSASLEEGKVTPGTVITVPEEYDLFGRTIREAHERKEGESDDKTVSEIFEQSLNVGTTLLALDLGEEIFYRYMRLYGFGERAKVSLPGESAGLLKAPDKWSKVDIGMMSFGQGVGVTTLQLATALSVIANGGTLVKPRVVHYKTDHEGVTFHGTPQKNIHRVISQKTARLTREAMARVVTQGTGGIVRLKGFSLA
ncbi:hypothetical protein DID77_02620 [Candidatus Marinamargulisbacteria bacterium SCGC AG-439-L15]|nr:hypothetical protein DID77_02620 [Candidatus Marinamargulisbacteria bacterium SCGC AG-439-L15]